MATFYQTDQSDSFHPNHVAGFIDEKSKISLKKFQKILNSYALFHLTFISLLAFLTISALTLLAISPSSLFFALFLATIFLTLFSYITMAFYFETRKKDQFQTIAKDYFQECKRSLPLQIEDDALHHAMAESCLQFMNLLRQDEIYGFTLHPFHFLEKTVLKWRYLLHHRDILFMQEILVKRAIDEYIQTIEDDPTSLETHTSLANLFITLSKLYQVPEDSRFQESYIISLYYERSGFNEKRLAASRKALEELKILDELAPEDPWIHAKLAACYNSLEMLEEEIKEYEILKDLRPEDKEILFRLGLLYFTQGQNAKGLKLYQQLKTIDMVWAKNLLSNYTM